MKLQPGTHPSELLKASPKDIEASRRRRLRDIQDRAAELDDAGVKPMAAAAELGIAKELYRPHAASSRQRRRVREVVATPASSIPELTGPETDLLSALVQAHHERFDHSELSDPLSWRVSSIARRARGWSVTTARKRLEGNRYAPEPTDGTEELMLVQCSGNGYVGLTDRGWRVAAALWPDRVDP